NATLEASWDSTKNLWYVSLPPRLSPTGKRKREYFSFQQEAEKRARQLKEAWQRGLSLIHKAGPRLIEDAVVFDELFQIYGYRGLREACEAYAAQLETERKSSHFKD